MIDKCDCWRFRGHVFVLVFVHSSSPAVTRLPSNVTGGRFHWDMELTPHNAEGWRHSDHSEHVCVSVASVDFSVRGSIWWWTYVTASQAPIRTFYSLTYIHSLHHSFASLALLFISRVTVTWGVWPLKTPNIPQQWSYVLCFWGLCVYSCCWASAQHFINFWFWFHSLSKCVIVCNSISGLVPMTFELRAYLFVAVCCRHFCSLQDDYGLCLCTGRNWFLGWRCCWVSTASAAFVVVKSSSWCFCCYHVDPWQAWALSRSQRDPEGRWCCSSGAGQPPDFLRTRWSEAQCNLSFPFPPFISPFLFVSFFLSHLNSSLLLLSFVHILNVFFYLPVFQSSPFLLDILVFISQALTTSLRDSGPGFCHFSVLLFFDFSAQWEMRADLLTDHNYPQSVLMSQAD